MADRQHDKTTFATKLTLPKFMAVAVRLTLEQQKLVRSMDFENVLDIACDTLPRGVALWMAGYFNVHTRTFELPNGLKIHVTPFCMHQILGIPLGGRKVEKCTAQMRTLIAEQTNCKGNFPTIAELEKMITPGLGGDLFKRVFLMFVLATFICPSSHGAASPEYYHALEDPDNIASFDWCTAALDKLVLSIENWQKAGTSVLGGNLLSIVILYFEFIDINIMKATTTLPRLSLWTTQMISEYERMDCMSFPLQIYGKLPVKDVSQTPFSMDILNRNILLQGNSYREFQQFIMSAVPQQNQKMEKAKASREMLTYYLIVHPCNECLMPETKEILSRMFHRRFSPQVFQILGAVDGGCLLPSVRFYRWHWWEAALGIFSIVQASRQRGWLLTP